MCNIKALDQIRLRWYVPALSVSVPRSSSTKVIGVCECYLYERLWHEILDLRFVLWWTRTYESLVRAKRGLMRGRVGLMMHHCLLLRLIDGWACPPSSGLLLIWVMMARCQLMLHFQVRCNRLTLTTIKAWVVHGLHVDLAWEVLVQWRVLPRDRLSWGLLHVVALLGYHLDCVLLQGKLLRGLSSLGWENGAEKLKIIWPS